MSSYLNFGSDTIGHMELHKCKGRLVAFGCAGANPGCRLSFKCRDLLQETKNKKVRHMRS